MTDYSKISDYEVNCQVAFHIGLRTVELAEEGTFDPCNNPADAWPIIEENNITIINDIPSRRYAVNDAAAFFNGVHGLRSWADENGFRAAMIVFLMMKEAGNV